MAYEKEGTYVDCNPVLEGDRGILSDRHKLVGSRDCTRRSEEVGPSRRVLGDSRVGFGHGTSQTRQKAYQAQGWEGCEIDPFTFPFMMLLELEDNPASRGEYLANQESRQ